MRKPLEIAPLTAEEVETLEKLYRTTRDVRQRTRAQIVLLAGEQRLTAPAIAAIVRENDQTVRNWLKRWMVEGLKGLKDRPMPGAPPKITKESPFSPQWWSNRRHYSQWSRFFTSTMLNEWPTDLG